jgi:Bacterial protein of unknown function (DUF903)
MNKALGILAAGLLLCGCARHYVITLSNGSQIGTRSKPHLKNGFYIYKDALGNESYISEGRVVEISRAGTTSSQPEPFKPEPVR